MKFFNYVPLKMLIILCSGHIQSVSSPFTFGEMSRYTNVVEVQGHAFKK